MGFATKLILWIAVIWLSPLMYFLNRREMRPKGDLVCGVTIPRSHYDDPLIKTCTDKHIKHMGIICVALFAAAAACMFIKDGNTYYRAWCIWIVLCIILPYVPFARCNIELKRIKAENRWSTVGTAEDNKWLWGLVYNDPDDARVLVPARYGENSGINWARTGGKIIYALLAAAIISLLFVGELMGSIGKRPMELSFDGTEIVSVSGRQEYSIAEDEIISVELLEKLPEKLYRNVGIGTENLLRGDFSASEIGKVKVCLDPECPPYILVTKTSGQKYLLGTRDGEATREVYNSIQKAV